MLRNFLKLRRREHVARHAENNPAEAVGPSTHAGARSRHSSLYRGHERPSHAVRVDEDRRRDLGERCALCHRISNSGQ
jgi:hypothetical protein